MQIREFTPADHASVLRLWEETVGVSASDSLDELAKVLGRDPELFLVAVDGAAVIGTVIGTWDGRRGWLYHLAVAADRRRRGVATALLAEVERRLRAKGARKVNLLMWRTNEAARALYRRSGYAELEDLAVFTKRLV
ncbi:MAG TPA: GNAT family N-acetyltransferase [Limnochordia bacterium]